MNNNEDKTIVQKPKVEDVEIEKSLEEHMEDNRNNVKTKIDVKSIITYIIMSIIVVVCLILLVHFCEKQMQELNKPTTTIKEFDFVSTSILTIDKGTYVSTSRLQTAATHTVFDATNHYTSKKSEPTRTNTVVPHTTVSTSTSSTTVQEEEEETTTSRAITTESTSSSTSTTENN